MTLALYDELLSAQCDIKSAELEGDCVEQRYGLRRYCTASEDFEASIQSFKENTFCGLGYEKP